MKLAGMFCTISFFALWAAFAESPAPHQAESGDSAQFEVLAKKIDEQNAKIDALSQEILKLEQQLSRIRPGVMVGEAAPAPATAATRTTATYSGTARPTTQPVAGGKPHPPNEKMYRVTVDD